MVKARGLTKNYGKHAVLRGVDFEAAAAQIIGVTGENGSGKSTLLQILAGWTEPSGGTVDRHCRIGYCPQEAMVFDTLTVAENLSYFARSIGLPQAVFEERSASLIKMLQLEKYEKAPAAELSGGSRQKLNLIIALLNDPQLLLLDEPCSGLDWSTYLSFWDFAKSARASGKSVVIVSHLIHERSFFDALYTMQEGVLSLP